MSHIYEELLSEIEELAKSLPEADEALGAKENDDPDNDGDVDTEGAAGDTDNDEGKPKEGEPMAKSMTLTDENGEAVEVIDGMELIKSMQDKLDATVEGFGKVIKAQNSALEKQAELVKSLTGELTALRSEGRGRKSAVVQMEGGEAPLAKSMESAPADILAKCLDAQKAGRLTALDVSIAEGYINRGMAVPEKIAHAIS